MGKLVVSENVTLDGVVQDPAGDEGFRLGGRVGLIKDRPGVNRLALDKMSPLLGRRIGHFNRRVTNQLTRPLARSFPGLGVVIE